MCTDYSLSLVSESGFWQEVSHPVADAVTERGKRKATSRLVSSSLTAPSTVTFEFRHAEGSFVPAHFFVSAR